jgi:hypothetical protein
VEGWGGGAIFDIMETRSEPSEELDMSKVRTSKKLRPFDEARYSIDEARAPERTRDTVAELAAVLKGSEIGDPREGYTEYLRKKYS